MNGYDNVPRSDLVLSVVVPVYNELQTLPRVLRSIALALPDVPKEILVVDDGSTDGTRQWLLEVFPGLRSDIFGLRINSEHEIEFLTTSDTETAGEPWIATSSS